MSGTRPTDNTYFAFTLPPSDEGDWLSSKKSRPSLRGLYWALLASLAIHVLFFQWQPPAYKSESKLASTKSLHLTLNYTPPPNPLPRQPVLNAEPAEEIAEPLVEQPISAEEPAPAEPVIEPDVPPEPLDEEALQTTIVQQNRYRDAYMPTTESNTEFSIAAPAGSIDGEQTPDHFNDVFDPRLRARLQNNPVRGTSEQASGPTGFTNIHGNTLVELDNGLCMSATPAVPGQPTNWYLTACGGKKNESEQMMERVNRDFQNRR
jgi:hypothetical protein